MKSVLYLLISCLWNYVELSSNDNLYFVLEHFRHGARSPTNGLNKENVDLFGTQWKGNGELTTNGMIQQYILGLNNKKKYGDFYNTNYDPKEILVYSTNVNRTITSAQVQLSGMYSDVDIDIKSTENDPRKKPPFNITFDFQKKLTFVPVPIHIYEDRVIHGESVVEKTMDYDRDVNCIKYKAFREKNKQTSKVLTFINDFNKTEGEYLIKKFNIPAPDNYKNIHALCDVYVTNYYEHYDKIKENFTDPEHLLNKCYEFEKIKQYFVEQGDEAAISGRISQSGIVRRIIRWMELRKEQGEANRTKTDGSKPKFVMYSAHDTTLSSMQSYFIQAGLQEKYVYTKYASVIYLELRKYGDTFYVQYYLNEVMLFNKTFDEFKSLAEKIMWTDDQVIDYCVGYTKKEILIIILGCALIAFFVVTISLMCYFCRKKRRREFIKVVDSKEETQ